MKQKYPMHIYTVQQESLSGRMFVEFTLFEHLAENVGRMNRSAEDLLIVTTLDGFSLANCRQFTKFA